MIRGVFYMLLLWGVLVSPISLLLLVLIGFLDYYFLIREK